MHKAYIILSIVSSPCADKCNIVLFIDAFMYFVFCFNVLNYIADLYVNLFKLYRKLS